MKAIQVLLIGMMLLYGVIFIFRLRGSIFVKPALALLFLTGIFFVLFPDTTTVIAHLLGVDRGADMIFYLYIVASLIAILHFYSKLRSLQADLTLLIRDQAIKNAIKMGNTDTASAVDAVNDPDA